MKKKKGKGKGIDLRGYASSSSSATTVKKVTQLEKAQHKHASFVLSDRTEQLLLKTVQESISTATATATTTASSTITKLRKLYYTLIDTFKFRPEQARMILENSSTHRLNDALAWAALNLEHRELPSTFSDKAGEFSYNEEAIEFHKNEEKKEKEKEEKEEDEEKMEIFVANNNDNNNANIDNNLKQWILNRVAEESDDEEEKEEKEDITSLINEFINLRRLVRLDPPQHRLRLQEVTQILLSHNINLNELKEKEKEEEKEEEEEKEKGEEKEEEEIELFDIFNLETTDDNYTLPTTTTTTTTKIISKNLSIDKSWKGLSPFSLLQAWCQKQLILTRRIDFDRRAGEWIRVHIDPSRNRRFLLLLHGDNGGDGDGSMLEFKVQQQNDVRGQTRDETLNLVATRSLFHLFGAQFPNLYLQLPQPFRNIFLDLIESKQSQSKMAQEEVNQELDSFLKGVLEKNTTAATPSTTTTNNIIHQPSSFSSFSTSSLNLKPLFNNNNNNSNNSNKISSSSTFILPNPLANERGELPIATYEHQLMAAIDEHHSTLISADTGSGKTTQVPQMILRRYPELARVVVCEPRRVAAVSVARRVASELGEPSCGGLVGYSVRLESNYSASNTRLLYCTTGVLLRRLLDDAELRSLTHLVLDEVHERTWQLDLLLAYLVDNRSRLNHLKVIAMSATMQTEELAAYMRAGAVVCVPGRTFDVKAYFLNDFLPEKRTKPSSINLNNNIVKQLKSNRKIQSSSVDAVLEEASTTTEAPSINELILQCLYLICIENEEYAADVGGAVLVFLPGAREIDECRALVRSSPPFNDCDRFQLLAMHSKMTDEADAIFAKQKQQQQQRRKIIFGTNIFETGVTIADVAYVIDTCLAKRAHYITSLQLRTLRTELVSRAAVLQRRGRAGRTREGVAFHLIRREQFDQQLRPYDRPELLSMQLQEVILHLLGAAAVRGDEVATAAIDVFGAFRRLPSPPTDVSITSALVALQRINAIVKEEEKEGTEVECKYRLTGLGKQLARLPMDYHLGRLLISACLLRCVEPIATICAALCDRSSPFDSGLSNSSIHEKFFGKDARASDLFAYVNCFESWRALTTNERAYCNANSLSLESLRRIERMRLDFLQTMESFGFFDESGASAEEAVKVKQDVFIQFNFNARKSSPAHMNIYSHNTSILVATIVAGLYPSVVARDARGQLRDERQTPVEVRTHLTSTVNVHVKSTINNNSNNNNNNNDNIYLFHDSFRAPNSQRTYVSNITTLAASPRAFLLFAGASLEIDHFERVVLVDKHWRIGVAPRTAVLVTKIRSLLDDYLARRTNDARILQLLIRLIVDDESITSTSFTK